MNGYLRVKRSLIWTSAWQAGQQERGSQADQEVSRKKTKILNIRKFITSNFYGYGAKGDIVYPSTAKQRPWLTCLGYSVSETVTSGEAESMFEDARSDGQYREPASES
jgi:hypothetical protein